MENKIDTSKNPQLLADVRKTKYEVYKYFLPAGAPADVVIDRNIDSRFKKVTDVFMYTNPVIANNVNLEVETQIKISDTEIFPNNFDSFVLFPIVQNSEFTKLRESIALNNSKIEGRLKSTGNIAADCYLKIVLKVQE